MRRVYLSPGLWGGHEPAPKRETTSDVARRVCTRKRIELADLLLAEHTGSVTRDHRDPHTCPLYGLSIIGDNTNGGQQKGRPHPLGCYGLREPRCVQIHRNKGVEHVQGQYAACAVYNLAQEITQLTQLERAPRQ